MRVAVVGAGVIGLATTVALLEREVEVTCFEQAAPMAERSTGESRIFRLAHPQARLVERAASSLRLFHGWEGQADEQLIDPVGTVVSGENAHQWAAAMHEAGAVCLEVGPTSELLRLPTRQIPAMSVIDPEGGVIRVDRVRAFLTARCAGAVRVAQVTAVQDGPDGVGVRVGGEVDGEWERFDAVILCAGAGTAALAAQVGLDVPAALAHHARFTYRLRTEQGRPARMQCWLTTSSTGFGSYQHSSGPGLWSVGGHVDEAAVAWDVGPEAAVRASEDATTELVRRTLDEVDPEVIDRLYCTVNPGLGDGVEFRRSGRVLTLFGENLFKFAPLIGLRLAEATVSGAHPDLG